MIFDKQVLLKYIFEPAQLLSLYNGYLVSYIIAIDQDLNMVITMLTNECINY